MSKTSKNYTNKNVTPASGKKASKAKGEMSETSYWIYFLIILGIALFLLYLFK
jgi:hypothetical protein